MHDSTPSLLRHLTDSLSQRKTPQESLMVFSAWCQGEWIFSSGQWALLALNLVNDCIHFTILHSKASLCPSKSTTALAMVLILLVKRICFEEFTYAIKEIDGVCLGWILGEQRHPNVDVYVLYIIKTAKTTYQTEVKKGFFDSCHVVTRWTNNLTL